MKITQSFTLMLIIHFSTVLILSPCWGMGTAEKAPAPVELSHVDLEQGEPLYEGTISDGTVTSDVDHISFAGKTTLKNILKETDDSANNLDLAKIKEIEVVEKEFISQKYRDKEFCLITIITHTNEVITHLLFPRFLVVCAREKKTEIDKSWFISKLTKIVIHPTPEIEARAEAEKASLVPEKSDREKTFIGKAQEIARKVAEMGIFIVRKITYLVTGTSLAKEASTEVKTKRP